MVLSGDGINCDRETAWALSMAGFEATTVHTGDLLAEPEKIEKFKLLAIPGGFSFGDEIASGKILAVKLKERLKEALFEYVGKGHMVIGICNGFQVLVQMGLLPNSQPEEPRLVSLLHNAGGKFINRWVTLTVDPTVPCPYLLQMTEFDLPIRHGEGRVALSPNGSPEAEQSVKGRAPLRYKDDINGSFDRIAALTNAQGNVFGLMPHPEAFVRWIQHPAWTQRPQEESKNAPGLSIFVNAASSLA